MEVIKASIMKHRKQGDYYAEIIEKCMADWEQDFEQERIAAGPPSDEFLSDLVDQLSVQILERLPTATEAEEYVALAKILRRQARQPQGHPEAHSDLHSVERVCLPPGIRHRRAGRTWPANAFSARCQLCHRLCADGPKPRRGTGAGGRERQAEHPGGLQAGSDAHPEEERCVLPHRSHPGRQELSGQHHRYGDPQTAVLPRVFRLPRRDHDLQGREAIRRRSARRTRRARLLNETDRIVEHILEKDQERLRGVADHRRVLRLPRRRQRADAGRLRPDQAHLRPLQGPRLAELQEGGSPRTSRTS